MTESLWFLSGLCTGILAGGSFMGLWWSFRAEGREAKAYERGWVWGRIETTAQRARQVDAGYRAGWLACEREYRRRAPERDVARRVLALQASRN